MTVAVVVKVYDGLVLAADSATTMDAGHTQHVYNNANKVFQLHRQYPVGAMTWGLGALGAASIATLCKDLRRRLMGNDPAFEEWDLTPNYTIEQVAGRCVEFFHDELIAPLFAGQSVPSALGILVAGYSAGASLAEAWEITFVDPSVRPQPELVIPVDGVGWLAFAQPQATQRLFDGIDPHVHHQIRQVLTPAEYAKIEPIIRSAANNPALAPMPLADAIELAGMLVHTTEQFSHFLFGPDTVGGWIDIASLSRHEGFRWISRKHYYDARLNPMETGHDL